MPYIEAKLSVKLDETQKNDLQLKLADAVSVAFAKPKTYIMTNIEDAKALYMNANKVNNAAYIAVSALGTVSKQSCQSATQTICNLLERDYGMNGSNVYITYHPVDFWGWNGSMF